MSEQQSIGLIGLGLLGSAIAERLMAGGTAVCGFDTSDDRRQALADASGLVADSAADVILRSDIVVLSLPNSDIVADMVSDYRSVFRQGQVVVDTTTGNPQQMADIGHMLNQSAVTYVEANVAGSSDQMRVGEAVLFAAADAELSDSTRSLLDRLAAEWFFLGPVGSASRFKLVHNLVLGLHRAVLAEGLTFADRLGFDMQMTLDILQQTPAASAVMATKGNRMITGNRQPQARLTQHLKDVRLMISEAERTGAKIPLTQLHQSLLETAESLGLGNCDNSAIIEAFR